MGKEAPEMRKLLDPISCRQPTQLVERAVTFVKKEANQCSVVHVHVAFRVNSRVIVRYAGPGLSMVLYVGTVSIHKGYI